MMIKVVVCGMERKYDSSLVSWIREQFHRRNAHGDSFWFSVIIDTDTIDLVLSSKTCPGSRARPKTHFTQIEQRIADMWRDMNVRTDDSIDPLLRFLYRVNEMLA